MKAITKGLILSNFIYMVLFYVIYFPLVTIALYFRTTFCGLDLFTTYCDQIPTSTTMAMNFMLFVVIPLAALIVTIVASREPEYQFTG